MFVGGWRSDLLHKIKHIPLFFNIPPIELLRVSLKAYTYRCVLVQRRHGRRHTRQTAPGRETGLRSTRRRCAEIIRCAVTGALVGALEETLDAPMEVHHVDGPLLWRRAHALGPAVDVREAQARAQRALAARRAEATQRRAATHRECARRQALQLAFQHRHRSEGISELLQQQLLLLVQSDAIGDGLVRELERVVQVLLEPAYLALDLLHVLLRARVGRDAT